LARLVWEHLTDLLTEGRGADLLEMLDITGKDGSVPQAMLEEILTLVLWVHTRSVQLAFHGRADPELKKQALDALHRAVFEDLVEQGTPRGHLPLLEQRVSARYAEYYECAEISDEAVGKAAVRRCQAAVGDETDRPEAARLATELALTMAHPLLDFLEEVELNPP
jgi:hypothetical protein